MKVTPSGIAEVDICGPDAPEFQCRLAAVLEHIPEEQVSPALPYSVMIANHSQRAIALLGVRFDMTAPRGKPCAVVHYADSLRNPSKADFTPGTIRFVCAEPAYTSLMAGGGAPVEMHAAINLGNLRRMLGIRASLDCVAFEDGQFAGPDTRHAFERLAHEREMELALVVGITGALPAQDAEKILLHAMEDPRERAQKTLARKLLEGLASGGSDEMLARAKNHQARINLWR